MDEHPSLWNTPLRNLTIGDYVKLNFIALAATTGILASYFTYTSIKEKRQSKRFDKEYDQVVENQKSEDKKG